MKCPAIIQMGDDHGDNYATFHCDLEEGHDGLHVEKGNMYQKHPYSLTWEGDMREACERCPARMVRGNVCIVCNKIICPECLVEVTDRPTMFSDKRCKACPAPPAPPPLELEDVFQ